MKSVKAWAVITPNGTIDPYSCAPTRKKCVEINGPEKSWTWMLADGYRCIPVLITPAKEGE